MANPTVFGTAHVYGVPSTITNATVVSQSLTLVHLNRGETVDENGNQIERRYDDLAEQGTITLRHRSSYTVAAPGSTISISNGSSTKTFEIQEVGKEFESQGFRQVTYSVLQSSNIAYA